MHLCLGNTLASKMCVKEGSNKVSYNVEIGEAIQEEFLNTIPVSPAQINILFLGEMLEELVGEPSSQVNRLIRD